jgi:hypothetical protein
MSNKARTTLSLSSLLLITGVIEALSFIRPSLFVPFTHVIVDASHATALVPLVGGIFAGHFWGPRPKHSDHRMLVDYAPLKAHLAVGLVLTLIGLASAVAFSFDLITSAFLAGYVMGSLYFLSGDRTK